MERIHREIENSNGPTARTHEEVKRRLLEDPEVRAEYDLLQRDFTLRLAAFERQQ